MKTLWVLLLAAAVALGLGCGKANDDEKKENGTADEVGAKAGGSVAAGSPEAVAEQMLEAMKTGDADGLFDCMDLRAVYEQIPEDSKGGMSFEEWNKNIRQSAREATEGQQPPQFEYEILGSEAAGDDTVVRIKFKDPAGGEGEHIRLPLRKVDGEWKVTAEGFMQVMGGE